MFVMFCFEFSTFRTVCLKFCKLFSSFVLNCSSLAPIFPPQKKNPFFRHRVRPRTPLRKSKSSAPIPGGTWGGGELGHFFPNTPCLILPPWPLARHATILPNSTHSSQLDRHYLCPVLLPFFTYSDKF